VNQFRFFRSKSGQSSVFLQDSNLCPAHVRERKLGTINIQNVHILQNDSAVLTSREGNFSWASSNLLPNNLAMQYIEPLFSVPRETALLLFPDIYDI
jgi:hypothetical protein